MAPVVEAKEAGPVSVEVVLLGTGNPLPDAGRAGPSTLVRAGERVFVVDAGRGVCMRMVAAGVLPLHVRRRPAHPSPQRPHLRPG